MISENILDMNWELEQIKKFIRSELDKGYDPKTVKSTLISSGFPAAEVKKAFATLGRKPSKAKIIKAKPAKRKGRGFFSKLFTKKPKSIKKKPKKPAPKPKPKPKKIKRTKKPGLLAGFFFKEVKPMPKLKKPKKIEKTAKKIELKKPKIKKHRKPFKLPKIPHIKETSLITFLIVFFIIVGVIIWAFPSSCATETCFINKANKCQSATFYNMIDRTTIKYETNNCVLKKTITALSPDETPDMVSEFLGKHMLCTYQKNDFSPLYINTLSGMLNTCEGELKTAILSQVV